MENTRQANVRRLQDTLIIAGDGVIAFGAWALVKTVLFPILLKGEELGQLALDSGISLIEAYVLAGVLLCIDLAVRVFVGLSARSEGRGEKKGPVYLIVATIVAIANASSVIATTFGGFVSLSVFDMAISILVETTALAALVTVVCCSVRLRYLKKTAG